MIKLKKIHLFADEVGELHTFARRMGLSRSWYQPLPKPHYDVICPFIQDRIYNFLTKKQNKHE